MKVKLQQRFQLYRDAGLLLLVYLAVGWAYVIQSPLLTRPDEPYHLAYIEYLKQHGSLPIMRQQRMTVQQRNRWEPEAHQPPLYYAMVAWLTQNNPMADADRLYLPNPHYLSTITGNTSAFAPAPSQAERVLYVGRFLSLLSGLLVGVFCYCIALELTTPITATLATAFAILNPQFLYIASAVSNDVPCAAAATWGLWLIIRMMQHGVTTRRALAFGLAVGFGTLIKLSVFGLVGLLPLLALQKLLAQRPLTWAKIMGLFTTAHVRIILIGALPALILIGPLFVYNSLMYGDPLTTSAIILYMGARQTPLTSQQWSDIVTLLWKGYWLDFSGGGAAYADAWVYWLAAAALIVGLLGAIMIAWRQPTLRGLLLLLAVWPLLELLALLSLMTRTALPLGGGRLLYPAVAALAILTAVGWAYWLPQRGQLMLTLLMAAMPLLALMIYLWPQGYAVNFIQERILPVAQGTYKLGDQVRVIGYTVEPTNPKPGSVIDVYVTWEAQQPLDENYSVAVQLWDMSDAQRPRVVSQVDTFPALGYWPTRRWSVGQKFVDHYSLKIPRDLPAGWHGLVNVGLYLLTTGQRLSLANQANERMPFDAAPLSWIEIAGLAP